jgi:hypothetical protein
VSQGRTLTYRYPYEGGVKPFGRMAIPGTHAARLAAHRRRNTTRRRGHTKKGPKDSWARAYDWGRKAPPFILRRMGQPEAGIMSACQELVPGAAGADEKEGPKTAGFGLTTGDEKPHPSHYEGWGNPAKCAALLRSDSRAATSKSRGFATSARS